MDDVQNCDNVSKLRCEQVRTRGVSLGYGATYFRTVHKYATSKRDINNNNNNNSVRLVCERTIPTKRPPLVGQVSANFCG
jgi:hypothetical protein